MTNDSIQVNLHCHSNLSDGLLSPKELARFIALGGTAFAALTDHNTLDGVSSFREVLGKHAVGNIDGVELSSETSFGEIHLLAYGLKTPTTEFRDLISCQGNFKRKGTRRGKMPLRSGNAHATECIQAAHRAGWSVFLAHPLNTPSGPNSLEMLLDELIPAGLDGIEAIYGPYNEETRASLSAMARRRNLLVCAGSDFHEPEVPGQTASVKMPMHDWKAFRDHLILRTENESGKDVKRDGGKTVHEKPGKRWSGRFLARIIFPALIALVLFVAMLFALILPNFEKTLLERKKDMIRELTDSVISVIGEFYREETKGSLSRETAQNEATVIIRDIRYGKDGKDYFWITDMAPKMIMHPYRMDLMGENLLGYRDTDGFPVFKAFVDAVRDGDEGYVEYLWQWMDEADRIVPKLSFVKKFEPWDWVIGTGVYLEDVHEEIARIERGFIWISIGITGVLILILSFIAQQSLAIERERLAAENSVKESRERYYALVEASTEGMAIVIDGRCTFANGSFLEMTGYSEAEICLLGPEELFEPYSGEEAAFHAFLQGLSLSSAAGENLEVRQAMASVCECRVRRRLKVPLEAAVSATRFALSGKEGLILAVKELGESIEFSPESTKGMGAQIAAALGQGSFRTRFARKATVVEVDSVAKALFGIGKPGRANFSFLFVDPSEIDSIIAELNAEGKVLERVSRISAEAGESVEVFLSAAIVRDSEGKPRFIDWFVAMAQKRLSVERRREAYLAELRSNFLFMEGSLAPAISRIPSCGLNESIRKASEVMKKRGAESVFITEGMGNPIGIVSVHDVNDRAVAESVDLESSVAGIMTAPIVWIEKDAPLSEAFSRLREKGTGGLAVREPGGEAGYIKDEDLFRLYTTAPMAIREHIKNTDSPDTLRDRRLFLLEHVRNLAQAGIGKKAIVRLFASFSDMIFERAITLAVNELGTAPEPFAFMEMGSGGRKERLPYSDQDNALVFLGRGEDPDKAKKYFRNLGGRVCDILERIGIPPCNGGIMARNPEWCVSLEEWKAYFSRWIREPDSKQLLDLNIFFDFRHVSGDAQLTEDLKKFIAASLAANPGFFLHLAKNALQQKAPSPAGGEGAGKKPGELKDAAARIAGFARLYALKHGVWAVGTLARLEELEARGVLTEPSRISLAESFEFLLSKRLEIQLKAQESSSPFLEYQSLPLFSQRDEALFRLASAQISLFTKRIGFDFFGSAL